MTTLGDILYYDMVKSSVIKTTIMIYYYSGLQDCCVGAQLKDVKELLVNFSFEIFKKV